MYQRPFGCDENASFVVKCRGLRAGSLVVVAEQIETSNSIVRVRFMPHLGWTHVTASLIRPSSQLLCHLQDAELTGLAMIAARASEAGCDIRAISRSGAARVLDCSLLMRVKSE